MNYTVRYGDTLRMIAQRELGDAELWYDIATLNNLSYPFISDTTQAGVVTPGDTISLPLGETFEVEEKVSFGTDLLLTTDKSNLSIGSAGDLSVGLDGDYELVSEMKCLHQDLSHRKMTPVGTLPYHSDYGSHLTTIVGSKKDENWKIKAQLETERTVLSDPRVTELSSIEVSDAPTGIKIDYTGLAQGIRFRAGGVEGEEI